MLLGEPEAELEAAADADADDDSAAMTEDKFGSPCAETCEKESRPARRNVSEQRMTAAIQDVPEVGKEVKALLTARNTKYEVRVWEFTLALSRKRR